VIDGSSIGEGRRVNWFNPSIAHQLRCSSEVVFESGIGQHELHVNWSVRPQATDEADMDALDATADAGPD
jgi:hypothetical protein